MEKDRVIIPKIINKVILKLEDDQIPDNEDK